MPTFFIKLALRQAGVCLTLLYNIVEENLRGMNERMTERMIDTHSGFLILDLSWTKLSAFCYPIFKVFPRQALSTHVLVHLSISFIFFMFASSPLFIRTCLWQSVKGYYKMIQDFKNSNIGSRTVNEIISHLGTAQHILLISLCHCQAEPRL